MLIHRRSNDDHHRRTGHGTSAGTTRALLGAALAFVVGSVAWVGSIAGAGGAACDEAIGTYRLTEPGSYSAFVRSTSGPAHLEVRGPGGELLVASPSTATTAAVFDLPTAMRFGVPAPAVFEVDTHVDLQVDPPDAPYELVLIRFGDSDERSGLDVHPPTTVEPDVPERCRPDDPRLERIRLDSVYSDVTARQAFVIPSHERLDTQPVRLVMRS